MPSAKFSTSGLIENREQPIVIENFGGLVPLWYNDTNNWQAIGNKNQASYIDTIDIRDPNFMTGGGAQTTLTNGTQAGSVTTLIKRIMPTSVANGVTYAIGGNKLYKIESTTITSDANWPHTIDKASVTDEDGEDVIYYKSNLYYFYNHSGSAGDIGKYDISAGTFDDDWGSTVPTGKETLKSAPHQALLGGDDDCYFTNGNCVGAIRSDGSLDAQALDFWTNAQIAAIAWASDRIIIAVNRPNISGSNFNESGIYKWDGVSPSWDGDPIEVSGRISALYVKNGVIFVWWQDSGDEYNFGYVNGSQLVPIQKCEGSPPYFYQICEYESFLAWVDSKNHKILLWGAKDPNMSVSLFYFTKCQYTTVGGIGTPLGKLLVASCQTIDQTAYYSIRYVDSTITNRTGEYQTVVFRTSLPWYEYNIDTIMVETSKLSSGDEIDFVLYYNGGDLEEDLTPIIYDVTSPYRTRHKILNKSFPLESFALDIQFISGTPKIYRILITGHYTKCN